MPKAHLHKQALWSLLFTGLVIATCLASTLSTRPFSSVELVPVMAHQTNANIHADSEPVINNTPEIEALYSAVFSRNPEQIKRLPSKEPCSLSEKMLTYSAPKLHWLAAFLLLATVIYSVIPTSLRRFREEQGSAHFSKHRLHLTYCIFRE